jgi:hypothetical protein
MSDLSAEHEQLILDNYDSCPDLIELTRLVFGDETLDGRTKEGRTVRSFLIEQNLSFKTTKREKVKPVNLSKEQREFILNSAEDGMSAYEIACIMFPDKRITPLSKETLVAADYIKRHAPEQVHPAESALGQKYIPPQNLLETLGKINEFANTQLDLSRVPVYEKKCIEMLKNFLSAPRFLQTINRYYSQDDRLLFEAEFIRATWDKADLTADEINLYINVCVDYINLKNISGHIEKLNCMFNDADEQQDMTVRLAELLKTKSEEYNQCEKRMESLIQRLNGDRAKRIDSKRQQNASILSLVRLFQDEEERKRMVLMAEMQKEAVGEEVNRIESMVDWKARVLGIGREDVL